MRSLVFRVKYKVVFLNLHLVSDSNSHLGKMHTDFKHTYTVSIHWGGKAGENQHQVVN